MKAKLVLSYVGTRYAGWQRQANAVAVQQVLEEALADLSGTPVTLTGAGRTDAGVHADGQVASFELASELPSSAWVFGTNQRLPADVRVLDATIEPAEFDAQRDATAKTYRYRLERILPIEPAREPFVVPAPPGLDLSALSAAASALVGERDFAAFELAGAATRTTRRTIFAAAWEERGSELVFRVIGSGFLRGMVRSLVGTMLEVGAGRRGLADFVALFADGPRPRSEAGATAPAKGLSLERVHYV